MERGDEGLVGELGEFGGGEFGEGAGEGGLVGELMGVGPATEGAQGSIRAEGVEELAGVGKAVDAFGDKGAALCDIRPRGEAVLAGAAVPAAAGEIAGERDHGAGGDEERLAIVDLAEDGFEAGEEFVLEKMGELRKF